MIYTTIAIVCMSEIAFCLLEATSVADYGKSFYGFVQLFGNLLDFITTIWQISNIEKLIKKYEMFILKRK